VALGPVLGFALRHATQSTLSNAAHRPIPYGQGTANAHRALAIKITVKVTHLWPGRATRLSLRLEPAGLLWPVGVAMAMGWRRMRLAAVAVPGAGMLVGAGGVVVVMFRRL
jgi:hypothetical protein